MKVIVKETVVVNDHIQVIKGSELQVTDGWCGTDGYMYRCQLPDGVEIPINSRYLEITDYKPFIDWDKILIKSSVKAMHALMLKTYTKGMGPGCSVECSLSEPEIARKAVRQAEYLVLELKKKINGNR